MSDAPAAPSPPPFDARLAFLRRALTPPRGGRAARLIETHLSWVVLGADRVLKVKKPVGHPSIDLSCPAVRRHNAHEEVRLNRRLAPGVYLGVLALEWRDGALTLVPDDPACADAAAIDWVVHMRRLPAPRMLDELVARRQFDAAQVARLAALLAAFHSTARRVALSGAEYLGRVRDEARASRAVLIDPRVAMAGAAATCDRFDAAIMRHATALARRAEDGRLVEGHGDLRPEHVCMLATPVVIDCLEFDARLRELDPLDEVAFLALEIELLGDGTSGRALWWRCRDLLLDPADDALRRFYTARRALLRARLVAAHLLERPVAPRAPWRERARRYLELADHQGAAAATLAADHAAQDDA